MSGKNNFQLSDFHLFLRRISSELDLSNRRIVFLSIAVSRYGDMVSVFGSALCAARTLDACFFTLPTVPPIWYVVVGVNVNQEVHRVCEEERRSSKSFMRRVKTLEEENR